MSRTPHLPGPLKKRRTTLTLPADSFTASGRSEEVLEGYKKAFSGFSDEEIAILDGVILEPAARQ
ncbi:MAG: hypothetical protein ACLQU1_08760 [Bryobacteraceae bacterium]